MQIQISRAIFWDVDYDKIDAISNAPFVVERVLSMGTLEDFNAIKDFYGTPKLKQIVRKLRYMDERVMHFCSVYFNIKLNSLRCYQIRQSTAPHWNY